MSTTKPKRGDPIAALAKARSEQRSTIAPEYVELLQRDSLTAQQAERLATVQQALDFDDEGVRRHRELLERKSALESKLIDPTDHKAAMDEAVAEVTRTRERVDELRTELDSAEREAAQAYAGRQGLLHRWGRDQQTREEISRIESTLWQQIFDSQRQ